MYVRRICVFIGRSRWAARSCFCVRFITSLGYHEQFLCFSCPFAKPSLEIRGGCEACSLLLAFYILFLMWVCKNSVVGPHDGIGWVGSFYLLLWAKFFPTTSERKLEAFLF